MEKREMRGQQTGYERSRVNFFGKRAKASDTAPAAVGPASKEQTSRTGSANDGSVGKPYFPSNGHHRNLNLLGRSSLGTNDRLLTNR
jgi:hypothetical protein